MEQQTSNCLNCNAPIEGKEGKRAKKYCNDACRASHWSKTHSKKGIRWVRKEVYETLLAEHETLKIENEALLGKINLLTGNTDHSPFKKGGWMIPTGDYPVPPPVFYEMPKMGVVAPEITPEGVVTKVVITKPEKQPVIKDKGLRKPSPEAQIAAGISARSLNHILNNQGKPKRKVKAANNQSHEDAPIQMEGESKLEYRIRLAEWGERIK